MTRKTLLTVLLASLLAVAYTGRATSSSLGMAVVLSGGANFRMAPDMKSRLIKTLPRGTEVELMADVNGSWFRASHDGRTGYIHNSRVECQVGTPLPQKAVFRGALVTARQEAVVAFSSKNWSEVIRLLHPWSDHHAVEFNDLFMLGMAFLEVKQPDNALVTFEQAIARHRGAIDTAYIEAHRQLGVLYLQLKQWELAVETYQRLIDRMPVLVWAMLGKGEALVAGGKTQEAVVEYTRAVHCEPENPEPYVKLGNAFMVSKDYKNAIKSYRMALQKRNSHEEAIIGLSDAYIKTGHVDMARKLLVKANAASPEFVKVRRALAELERGEKVQMQLDQARHELKSLSEQMELSGVVPLEVSVIARIRPHLYEVCLPSGKHALLRTEAPKLAETEGTVSILATRHADARVQAELKKKTDSEEVPYFKQITEHDQLAFENMRFKQEQKKRLIAQLEKQLTTTTN